MFMGHYGPAVWDTQRGHAAPIVTLWQAFIAVQFIDIVFAVLVILGLEGAGTMSDGKPIFDIVYSHSLINAIALAVFAGGAFRLFKPRAGARGFWVIFALVFSHWILDWVVHRPDLPLYPGGAYMMGLGLWDCPWLAFALEIGLLLAAFAFWQRVTQAKPQTRPNRSVVSLWALFAFMVIIQVFVILMPGLEVKAGTFNPDAALQGPALGVSALISYAVLTLWIWSIERARVPKLF